MTQDHNHESESSHTTSEHADQQEAHHEHAASSGQPHEEPHVHESVKDVDELIAAMNHVEEGMPEEDEAEEEPEPAKAPEEPREEGPPELEEIRKAKERLSHIKSKMLTLQWDLEHGQINPAKKALYEKLKPEYDALLKVVGESSSTS